MGRPKQLLPFGDRTVLQCVVENALAAEVGPVLVVLGHRAEEIAGSLGGRPAGVVVNAEYRRGMLSSVQAGVRAALPLLAEPGCRGFLFCLGDQPHVGPETFRRVAGTAAAAGRGIVLPTFAGRRGHPAAYAARFAAEILALGPDATLRDLLSRHPDEVLDVPVTDAGVLLDMDTPEEYARLTMRGV